MHITAKEISDYVIKVAPVLGSVISETNPIAGMVIELIARMFGANPSDPTDIMKKMSTDPDSALKLKQLEYNHEEVLSKITSEEYQASIQDTMNSRDRELQVIKLTGKRDYIIDSLAIIITLGFFTICVLAYFIKLPDEHIRDILLGLAGGSFLMVNTYYFTRIKNT